MDKEFHSKTDYTPKREAARTETMQIGMVVRDLDATIRRYADDFGIGPWQIFEVNPENAPDLLHDGRPLEGSARSVVAMIGSVMWELTEPLDDKGIFARFLAEKGEGVHHIAVATANYHDLVEEHTRRGVTFPLSGSFTGVDITYLPTDRTLGVILEVFSGFPGENDVSDTSGGKQGQ